MESLNQVLSRAAGRKLPKKMDRMVKQVGLRKVSRPKMVLMVGKHKPLKMNSVEAKKKVEKLTVTNHLRKVKIHAWAANN